MRGLYIFMILVMIPAMVALGHDIYLFVDNDTIDGAMRAVKAGEKPWTSYFATLGWIWTHYDPESYKMMAENLDEQSWGIINKLLAYKAVVVGLGFGLFFWVLAFIFNVLGVWPFNYKAQVYKGTNKANQKFQYKRK